MITRAMLYVTLACSVSVGLTASAQDSSYAALQKRGGIAMGVDQYTSVHKFDDLADGGRIELQRDVDDAAGTAAIRAHLKGIAAAFKAGDFSTPALVHMKSVPGTEVMARRRSSIAFLYAPLPRGGELRIHTSDSASVKAVHEFMAFQRGEHHAGGHQMHGP
ncbi:MAG: hypothetical protein ABIY52_18135 [Gemmatimonadaceae bacterium]